MVSYGATAKIYPAYTGAARAEAIFIGKRPKSVMTGGRSVKTASRFTGVTDIATATAITAGMEAGIATIIAGGIGGTAGGEIVSATGGDRNIVTTRV